MSDPLIASPLRVLVSMHPGLVPILILCKMIPKQPLTVTNTMSEPFSASLMVSVLSCAAFCAKINTQGQARRRLEGIQLCTEQAINERSGRQVPAMRTLC